MRANSIITIERFYYGKTLALPFFRVYPTLLALAESNYHKATMRANRLRKKFYKKDIDKYFVMGEESIYGVYFNPIGTSGVEPL